MQRGGGGARGSPIETMQRKGTCYLDALARKGTMGRVLLPAWGNDG